MAAGQRFHYIVRVQNGCAMKIPMTAKLLACAALLLASAATVPAQNIYKCTQAGRVEYTDHPCPDRGELIHRADDREVIDHYLHLGQDAAAKRYASSLHLDALYQERHDAYQQQLQEKARRQADEALAAQQRAEAAQQQALADQAADRERLRIENDTLRQQNEQYRDQLAQPVYNDPPAYWGAVAPPHWEHGHRPPPSREPVFHPCRQLAGGRVQC
jgi:hypothetical protein